MPSWRRGVLSSSTQPGSSPSTPSRRTPETTDFQDASINAHTTDAANGEFGSQSSAPSHSRSHARSTSQTLPSLFGSLKKKHDTSSDSTQNAESLPNVMLSQTAPLEDYRGQKSKIDENDFDTGGCATCDSKLKWPRGISEFRCTTCLMVNDLKIAQRRTPSPLGPQGPQQYFDRSEALTGPKAADQEPSLTVARVNEIVNQCLESYFRARCMLTSLHNSTTSTTSSSPPISTPHLPTTNDIQVSSPSVVSGNASKGRDPASIGVEQSLSKESINIRARTSSRNPQSTVVMRPNRPAPPPLENQPGSPHLGSQRLLTRKPVPTAIPSPPKPNLPNLEPIENDRTSDTGISSRASPWPLTQLTKQESIDLYGSAKAIFKPLERMIAHSLESIDCLNNSFLTLRAQPQRSTRSEDDFRTHNSKITKDAPQGLTRGLSDLDGKTLLLGDVAENGSWWSGGDERIMDGRRKPEKAIDTAPRLVNSKTPSINWIEVRLWYNAIIEAGVTWESKYKEFIERNPVGTTSNSSVDELKDMDREITEARSHVQTTFIKACETLLKRPGRPLKRPDDMRFLLIILANPSLYPASATKVASESLRTSHVTFHEQSQLDSSRSATRTNKSVSTAWDRGQAFGVIKRTIGLLSNLPNECHRCLTSWFSRFEEDHFRQTIDLVESFVTRRLGRQHSRKHSGNINLADDLVPALSGSNMDTSAELHAALGLGNKSTRASDGGSRTPAYSDDWQVKAAARLMALLFLANKSFHGSTKTSISKFQADNSSNFGSIPHLSGRKYQLLPTSAFYNTMLDYSDLIADFDAWESKKVKFSFCQYPFFISMGAKIRIMEHDARRQMAVKAREAFFTSILQNRNLGQYLVLKVRRDCLVEDSMKSISEVVGAGQEEIKKGLKVQFVNEEGIDAGGLRKEWFLLLVREIFDPRHGMFLYDDDSHLCYFNPHSFETSDQYFLVGALLGLAIYNSTILDVALPPFTFKKLLMSASSTATVQGAFNKAPLHLTLDDLAEYRPVLANGLRKLLEYDGNVQETFCRDFVADVERFGIVTQVPLCSNGDRRAVTNSNRQEFVDLYVRYLLDTSVARQFEPFKRGFFTVCGGNALSLFQAEEIELLVRGSDEALDVPSLRAVASYQNWKHENKEDCKDPAEDVPLIKWFWELFESANPKAQRKLLSFITGSDRIPAVGATSLVIKICFAGKVMSRLPTARTCFNQLLLYQYKSRAEFEEKLWKAVTWSEGFGLK